MSVIRANYDLERNVDEVWYESSNVIYSRFEEDDEENKGNLYAVFKGGKRYLYRNVSYMDYLYFKNGMVDGSTGKAFNEYIIKSYRGERVDDVDLSELLKRLDEPDFCDKTYFIHGDGEFDEFVYMGAFEPAIDYVVESYPDCMFCTMFSDAYGMRCVEHLLEIGVDGLRITIYMRRSDLEEIDDKFSGCNLVKIKDSRFDEKTVFHEAMRRSSEDIAFVPMDAVDRIADISKSAYAILYRRMTTLKPSIYL